MLISLLMRLPHISYVFFASNAQFTREDSTEIFDKISKLKRIYVLFSSPGGVFSPRCYTKVTQCFCQVAMLV